VFEGVSVQQVALWCLYIGILCVLCVVKFGVGLGSECAAGGFVVFVYRLSVCALCGTIWCGFWGVSVQQVVLWYLYIGIVCVCVCVCLCGTVWCGFGGVSVH